MNARRLATTFLLLVNSAALVMTILTLANGSSMTDVTSQQISGASDLLVVAQSDAALAMFLAILGIAANLVLGYMFLTREAPEGPRRDDAGPRITGE